MTSDDVFVGPFVMVLAKEPAIGGMLENVYLRRLGDRHFLTGKLADDGTGGDPRIGLTFWFAFDEVVMFTEYPDLEAAQSYFEHYKQQAAEQPTNKRRLWGR